MTLNNYLVASTGGDSQGHNDPQDTARLGHVAATMTISAGPRAGGPGRGQHAGAEHRPSSARPTVPAGSGPAP
jgi:hypothetical protein